MSMRQKHSSFLFILLIVLLVLVLAALFIFGGEKQEPQRGDPSKRLMMEGAMEWDGKLYRPRNDVTSVLLFGVSHGDAGEDAPVYGKERHISFIQLMIVDHAAQAVYRVPVDGEIMADIRVPGENGKTVLQQGPLYYAFGAGDGKEESCLYLTETVSKVLPVGKIDFYVSVEADNLQELLQIAAKIANAALPEKLEQQKTTSNMAARRARAQMQSQQMAQLLSLITQISSADEEQINRLFDAMKPYIMTDMPRGRMINEVWKMKPYRQLEALYMPLDEGDKVTVKQEEAQKLLMELFYQVAE